MEALRLPSGLDARIAAAQGVHTACVDGEFQKVCPVFGRRAPEESPNVVTSIGGTFLCNTCIEKNRHCWFQRTRKTKMERGFSDIATPLGYRCVLAKNPCAIQSLAYWSKMCWVQCKAPVDVKQLRCKAHNTCRKTPIDLCRDAASVGICRDAACISACSDWIITRCVGSLYKSMGDASLYKSMGAASLHKSMGAASLHNSMGAASLQNSMGAASLHNSMGSACLCKSMGAISLHTSMGTVSLHKSMGAASLRI